jgi:hypothetical protein
MAKKKADVKIESCGQYTPLEKGTKRLPKLLRYTDQIPCKTGVEFGYILHIRKGRGMKLTFQIDHPPFLDTNGELAPPFTGEEYVRTSDWKFFLGDTTWEPIENKVGEWRLRTWLDGNLVADRTCQRGPQRPFPCVHQPSSCGESIRASTLPVFMASL